VKVRPLLKRCLEKDPRRRLRDIGDAMGIIESTPEGRRVRGRWIAWGNTTLLLAALCGVSFVHFRENAAPGAADNYEQSHLRTPALNSARTSLVRPSSRQMGGGSSSQHAPRTRRFSSGCASSTHRPLNHCLEPMGRGARSGLPTAVLSASIPMANSSE